VIAPVVEVINREAPSCYRCGSSKRFRSIIAALSQELFGKVVPLPHFITDKTIVGLGLSDSDVYAGMLADRFSYTNTFYHRDPKLDIMEVDESKVDSADFVIASDVFEHVPPPVSRAFCNLHRLLKKDGVCIFSVPYSNFGEHLEFFPELFNYRVENLRGQKVLYNTTSDGREQSFTKLHFHGGSGETLVMRRFSKKSLLDEIHRAGFSNVRFFHENIPEHGILFNEGAASLVISMRKST